MDYKHLGRCGGWPSPNACLIVGKGPNTGDWPFAKGTTSSGHEQKISLTLNNTQNHCFLLVEPRSPLVRPDLECRNPFEARSLWTRKIQSSPAHLPYATQHATHPRCRSQVWALPLVSLSGDFTVKPRFSLHCQFFCTLGQTGNSVCENIWYSSFCVW